MRTLGIIPARGGSKGIPGKNVAMLAGKPLIAWTIEAARRSGLLSRVIVSTDDLKIAEVAQQFGGEVPFMRPAALAGDESPVVDAVEHALQMLAERDGEHYDAVLLLQPTSPLRNTGDIDSVLALARERVPPAIISVCEALPHPWLARTVGSDGTLDYLFPEAANSSSRQAYPEAFLINGAIYFSSCASLAETRKFQPPGTLAFRMPPERSLDIDSPWQLQFAEVLLSHG